MERDHRFNLLRTSYLFGLFGIIFQPLKTGDLFGYLVFGKKIINEMQIPIVDRFSYSAYGHAWINHEWLFQTLVAFIKMTSGWDGLLYLNLILVVFILLGIGFLCSRYEVTHYEWYLKVLLVTLAVRPGLSLRPQLFSYILLILLIACFISIQNFFKWKMLLLVCTFALWANLHGGVIVGLCVLAAFGIVERRQGLMKSSLKNLPFLLICFLATLVNPYGIDLWSMVFKTLSDPLTTMFIEEWNRSWESSYHFVCWFILILYTGGVLVSRIKAKCSIDWIRWLAISGVAISALLARRNLTYFGLVVAAFVPGLKLQLPNWLNTMYRNYNKPISIGLVSGLTIGGLFLSVSTMKAGFEEPGEGYPDKRYTKILKQSEKSNIFVNYQWAGWLLYQSPGKRVFIDQRWRTLYNKRIIKDYFKIINGKLEIINDYETDYALVETTHPINQNLKQSKNWTKEFGGKQATLWRYRKSSRK